MTAYYLVVKCYDKLNDTGMGIIRKNHKPNIIFPAGDKFIKAVTHNGNVRPF